MNWYEHIDKWDMIVQRYGDGGDTLQRWNFIMLCAGLRRKLGIDPIYGYPTFPFNHFGYLAALTKLDCGEGNYKRHPDPSKWYSDCDRMTRDQINPMPCALGLWSDLVPSFKTRLKRIVKEMIKRGFRTTNTTKRNVYHDPEEHKRNNPDWYPWRPPGSSTADFLGPRFWGQCIRGLRCWYLWPLLVVFDLVVLFNAIKYTHFSDRVDVNSHIATLLSSRHILPTPLSWLAGKVSDPADLYRRITLYYTRKDDVGDYGPPVHTICDLELLDTL